MMDATSTTPRFGLCFRIFEVTTIIKIKILKKIILDLNEIVVKIQVKIIIFPLNYI